MPYSHICLVLWGLFSFEFEFLNLLNFKDAPYVDHRWQKHVELSNKSWDGVLIVNHGRVASAYDVHRYSRSGGTEKS